MTCPTWERLRRLGDEPPGDPDFPAIEAHVEQCPDCQEVLERLVRQDPDEGPISTPEVRGPWPEVPGFALVRELGRGGGAVVFEAIRQPIGRRVALKVLDDRPGRAAAARQQWLREVRALGAIRHPSIVRLYDADEYDGRPFLVLDLIEGGSVQDRLDGPISPRIAAGLIARVARAVAELHRRGIRHLDVKPSNILLDGPGEAGWSSPMLADFGIACLDDDALTASFTTGHWGPRGTPAYMAPEQVSGRRAAIGPSADVYSLGATLYAMLTGGPPFPAATVLETLDQLRHREPIRPTSLVAGLPRDLETICLTCLNKQPTSRYRSAEALAEDLERWLSGRPILARPASRLEIAWRWSRRHPLPATLAVSLVATLIVGLAAVTVFWRNAEHARQAAQTALERAIAGESAAGEAITILTALLRSAVDSPDQLAKARTGGLLPGVLELTEMVRGSSGVLADHVGSIAALELELAGLLDRQTNHEAMRALLDDGIRLIETVPSRSADDDRTLASLRIYRALHAHRQGREADAIADTRAAIEVLGPHAGEAGWTEVFLNLDGVIEGITRGAEDGDSPTDRLARFYRERFQPREFLPTWASRARLGWTRTEPIEAILQQVGPLDRIPPAWVFALADGLAGELADWGEGEEAARLDEAAVGERSRRDLEAWDRRLNQPALAEALLERIGQQGMTRGHVYRQAERWDQARRSIRWMQALAESLATTDPDRPGVHLLISRAFDERARLADQLGDRVAAEGAWRRSLREAILAREQAPDEAEPRRHLAELRERYFQAIVRAP